MGGTYPPRIAPLRLLAPGFLGMDRRNRYFSLSLRGSLSYSCARESIGAAALRLDCRSGNFQGTGS